MLPRMADWIGREPAAEARKAGSASGDTLLTPRPPHPHRERSLRPLIIGQRCVQNPFETRPQQLIKVTQARVTMAGVLLSTCMSLVEPREYLKIRKASCLAISCSFSSAFPRPVTLPEVWPTMG